MDSILGIGPMELLVILIIAGIVMGPQRIAQAARWLGKFTAQMQAISRGFAMQLRNELDAIDDGGDLKEALKEVRSLQQEVSQLRREVTGVATSAVQETADAVNETKAAFKETEEMVQNSIMPPQFMEAAADEEADEPPASNGTPADSAEKKPEQQPQKLSANGQAPAPPPPPQLPNIIEVSDDPE